MKTKEQFKDFEDQETQLMRGLFGTVTLLGGAMMWLIMASISIYFQHSELGFAFIGLASLMLFIWVCGHVVPVLWKWIVSRVEL